MPWGVLHLDAVGRWLRWQSSFGRRRSRDRADQRGSPGWDASTGRTLCEHRRTIRRKGNMCQRATLRKLTALHWTEIMRHLRFSRHVKNVTLCFSTEKLRNIWKSWAAAFLYLTASTHGNPRPSARTSNANSLTHPCAATQPVTTNRETECLLHSYIPSRGKLMLDEGFIAAQYLCGRENRW